MEIKERNWAIIGARNIVWHHAQIDSRYDLDLLSNCVFIQNRNAIEKLMRVEVYRFQKLLNCISILNKTQFEIRSQVTKWKSINFVFFWVQIRVFIRHNKIPDHFSTAKCAISHHVAKARVFVAQLTLGNRSVCKGRRLDNTSLSWFRALQSSRSVESPNTWCS